METVSFRPEMVRWWLTLEAVQGRLGRVHRWMAAGHPPDGAGLHQHHTVTLVICLAGALRIEHPATRLDLAAGDAVLFEAGAWHRHVPPRGGAVAFGQGFMGGRSDWILYDRELQLCSSVPPEPSLRLLDAGIAESDEGIRRTRLALHLAGFLTERSCPIAAPHRAYPAMELALWDNLHRANAVEAMVQASGMSRAQAYRAFATCAGTSPAKAVRRERLALARRLLAEGVAATTVAARCGFTGVRALRRCLALELPLPTSR
jgi:AraC-like DNA-binding protein